MKRNISLIAPSLSDRCKEIILGSLLGDGSLKINSDYKNARFSFRHSEKFQKYFFWKVNELKEISGEKCFWKEKDGMLRYQSLALESLTEIYNFTHKKNKLTIKRKWLNLMTPLSLAVWWMDDGSLIKNSRQGVFCTDSFDLKSQKILAQYLLKVWNIKTKIGKNRKKEYYRLYIHSTEELKKFLKIILPYIPVEEMLYKVILLYNDSLFQQRWISEISRLTKFPLSVIEKHLVLKKAKWNKFQKMI